MPSTNRSNPISFMKDNPLTPIAKISPAFSSPSTIVDSALQNTTQRIAVISPSTTVDSASYSRNQRIAIKLPSISSSPNPQDSPRPTFLDSSQATLPASTGDDAASEDRPLSVTPKSNANSSLITDRCYTSLTLNTRKVLSSDDTHPPQLQLTQPYKYIARQLRLIKRRMLTSKQLILE